MYNRVVIYPYKMNSNSAKMLQAAIREVGIPCVRVFEDGRYKPKETDLIINWGNPRMPRWEFLHDGVNWLNDPDFVKVAANKLVTMLEFAEYGVRQPLFTTDFEEACNWVRSGLIVLARHILNGSGGRGIEIVVQDTEDDAEMPEAPLYVKYIRKIAEYRIHVFDGRVIDAQRKRKSREALANEEVNPRIRNHSNGWVFTRENCAPDGVVLALAVSAVSALGLDFGAVDIIVNREGVPYVLEVNTAPGLEGQTITSYAGAIIEFMRNDQRGGSDA